MMYIPLFIKNIPFFKRKSRSIFKKEKNKKTL